MCDYSLHAVAQRPARIGDKLVSSKFLLSYTRGFCEIGEPEIAVCLRPGTEIAFEDDVRYERVFSIFGTKTTKQKVAVFRRVDEHEAGVHHDALEFPDGLIVLLTRLVPGQIAAVLQMPPKEKLMERVSKSGRVKINIE